MEFVAIIALFDKVVGREGLPVLALAGVRMPVPLQRGQALSSVARTALRMNSERLWTPLSA